MSIDTFTLCMSSILGAVCGYWLGGSPPLNPKAYFKPEEYYKNKQSGSR